MPPMDDTAPSLIGVGIYTLPQAARLTSVPTSMLSRWLFGYRYDLGELAVTQPALVSVGALTKELRVITFHDLIETQFVHAFRAHGVSWKVLRLAVARARELTGSDHPFATRQFVTDGETVFAEIATKVGSRELLDLRNNQMAFRRVMLASLRAKLDLGKAGVERLWPLGKKQPIVIDPRRQFGQPITSDEGVPTEILAKAFQTQKSVEAVARWYSVPRASVRAAVKFEQRHAA
jgi:uncharacterized protein (DUF433 family)